MELFASRRDKQNIKNLSKQNIKNLLQAGAACDTIAFANLTVGGYNMNTPFIIAAIAYVVLCAGLITIILMQKKRQAGLGGGLAGMSSGGGGGSFWDKNKGNTLEGKLEKYTKIGGALFFALSMLLGILA